MMAVSPLRLRGAIPRLLAIAVDPNDPDRALAMEALCGLPDVRAVSVYLTAIEDLNPRLRKAGESALLAIRDKALPELVSAARKSTLSGTAALSLDRMLARFEPIRDWRVIGPFPKMAPQVFVGRSSIDLRRVHTGAWGRSVTWAPRAADLATGRVDLDDLKHGAGDGGGFGYDQNSSPDLCAFGYAEVEADRDGPALMLVGSSGTMLVTVNEQSVYQSDNPAGRGYSPDTDTVRLTLTRGRNRILVVSRQGIGPWCFSVQIAGLSSSSIASRSAPGAALEPSRSARPK